MRFGEIERQIESQYSAMRAFPSQGSTLEKTFSGANQRASIELQLEATKLLTYQERKLEKLSEIVEKLSKRIEQQHLAAQEREELEDERSEENMRFSKIAAWSGVVSILVAVVSFIISLWAQIALK